MLIPLFYRLVVFDSKGRVRSDTGRQRARSFIRGWGRHFYVFSADDQFAIVDQGGTSRTVRAPGSTETAGTKMFLRAEAGLPSADSTAPDRGVILGTGSTGVTNSDTALVAKIAHGTGGSQLDHQQSVISEVTLDAFGDIEYGTFTASRYFVNSSGGHIIAREMGIGCRSRVLTGVSPFFRDFLLVRDTVDATTIKSGDTAWASYTFLAETPWTKQWAQHVRANFLETLAGTSGVKDTSGVNRELQIITGTAGVKMAECDSGAGDTDYGPVAGTSLTPARVTDFKLGSLTTHGTSIGQLEYGAASVSILDDSGTTFDMQITRTVTNSSGADLTIREVGLIGRTTVSGTLRYFLLARQTTSVTITNGTSRTLRFRYTETVP